MSHKVSDEQIESYATAGCNCTGCEPDLENHARPMAEEIKTLRALLRDLKFYLQGQVIGANVTVNMWENINPVLRDRIEAGGNE